MTQRLMADEDKEFRDWVAITEADRYQSSYTPDHGEAELRKLSYKFKLPFTEVKDAFCKFKDSKGMGDKKDKDIKVAIRLRRLISREVEQGLKNLWTIDGGCQLSQKGDASQRPWMFDRVFDEHCSTVQVYKELVKPIVDKVMQGFNGTVFAYGQTSSGKTYTMMGLAAQGDHGILPCCVNDIYNSVESTPNREFLIRISFIEIYNEVVTDLLHPENQTLEIRENEGRIELTGVDRRQPGPCTEKVVRSPSEALSFIKDGESKRHYGATAMNEKSSRSHTIFRIVVESRERDDESNAAVVLVSHLNLVDLAGLKMPNRPGQRARDLWKEATLIEVYSLWDNFISYRDCKLTRILQGALGGNSMTAFICCVTPAVVEETVSTLRFASSAKTVKNKPVINEASNDSEALMRKYRRQITELEQKLEESRVSDMENLQQQLSEQRRLGAEKDSKIEALSMMLSLSSKVIIDDSSDRSKPRSRRRETWGGGQLLSMIRPLNESVYGDPGDNVNVKKRRGPSAGATKGSSTLCCLDENLEVDSPSAYNVNVDDDGIEYQRRSFEQMVSARSKLSLDKEDMFTMPEVGVQTDLVANDIVINLPGNDELLADIQQQLSSAKLDVQSAKHEAELARAELVACRADADAEVTACRAAVEQEIARANSLASSLNSELDVAKSEIDMLKSQLSSTASETSQTCRQIEHCVEKVEIDPALLELQARLSSTLAELEKVQQQAVSATNEVECLKVQLAAASCSSSELTTKDKEVSDSIIMCLRQEMDDLACELNCVKLELDRVKIAEESLKMENDNLKLQADLWKSGMERSKFEAESLAMELERSKLDSEFDKTIAADESQSELLITAKLAEERAQWDLEKKALMHQVKESFELSQCFAEQLTLLQEQLAESKKYVEIQAENAHYTQKELDDLKEYTRNERDYRDESILQHEEAKKANMELSSEVEKLQLQIEEYAKECSELRLELQQKDSDLISTQDCSNGQQATEILNLRQQLELIGNERDRLLGNTPEDMFSPLCQNDVACDNLMPTSVSTQTDIARDNFWLTSVSTQTDIASDNLLPTSVSTQTDIASDNLLPTIVSTHTDIASDNSSPTSVSTQTDIASDNLLTTSVSTQTDIASDNLLPTSVSTQTDISSDNLLSTSLSTLIDITNENLPTSVSTHTDIASDNSSPTSVSTQTDIASDNYWPTSVSTQTDICRDIVMCENETATPTYSDSVIGSQNSVCENKSEFPKHSLNDSKNDSPNADFDEKLLDINSSQMETRPVDESMQTSLLTEDSQNQLSMEYLKQIADLEKKLQEQTVLAIDAQDELMDLQDKIYALQTTLDDRLACMNTLTKQASESDDKCQKVARQLEVLNEELSAARAKILQLETASESDDALSLIGKRSLDSAVFTARGRNNVMPSSCEVADELATIKKEKEELMKMREKQIAECNRDQYMQKLANEHEQLLKETKQRVSELEVENKALNEQLNHEVQELTRRLQKEICDHQLAQHKCAEAERERARLKTELSSLENIASRQDVITGIRRPNELDPQRLQEHLKKLSLQLDLTNQRCVNYETKNKSLEAELKKNEDASFKLNTLQAQLRETEFQLERKREQLLKVEKMNLQLKAARTTLEEKLFNIDRSTDAKLESAGKCAKEEIAHCLNEIDRLKGELAIERHQTGSVNKAEQSNEQIEILQHELRCISHQLEQERSQCDEEKVAMGARLDAALAERDACVESLAQMKIACEKTICLADAEMNRLAEKHRNEMERLGSEHEALIRQTISEQESEMKRANAQYEDQIKQLQDKHQEEMTLHATDLAAEFGRRILEHETEIEKMALEMAAQQEELSQVNCAYQQLLADFHVKIAAVQDEKSTALSELRRQHADEIASCETTDDDAEMILTQKECEIAELESQLEDLHCRSATQLENAQRQHSDEMEVLKDKLATQFDAIKSSMQQHIADLEGKHQELTRLSVEQLESLRHQPSEEIESLRQQHSEEIESLRQQHSEEIKSLGQQHSEYFEAMKNELQQKIVDLEARHQEMTCSSAERRRQHSEEDKQDQDMVVEVVDKCTVLEQQLTESNQRITHLESVINAGRQMLEQLQAEKTEQATTIAAYEADLDDFEAERDSLVADLKVKEGSIAHLRDQLENVDRACSVAKLQLEEIKAEFDKVTAEQQELLSSIEKYTADNGQMQLTVNQLTLEKEKLGATVTQLTTDKASSDEMICCLSKRVAELEEIVKREPESPQLVEKLQEEIKDLKEEVYIVSKKFRGMEAQYKRTYIEKFEAKNETLAAQKQLNLIVGKVGCSESGLSFADALKGHQEEIARFREDNIKLRKYVDEADAERDDFMKQLLVSQEENKTLRSEMEKLQAPADVSELRLNLADSRLRINKLEHQLLKEKDPLEREIRGLKADLERSEELRRHLQNELRRSQSSADVTYAGRNAVPSSASSANVAIKGHSSVKSEPIDPSSCGIVGMMLVARTESEMSIMKRKNEHLNKTVAEYKEKFVEFKEKIDKQSREIVELRSQIDKRRLEREARPSPRRALSPRQVTPIAGFDGDTAASSSKLVEDPNKCRQQ